MKRMMSLLAIPLALALASCGDDDDNDPTDTATEADTPDEVVADVAEENVADAEPDPVEEPADDPVEDPVDDTAEDTEDDAFTPSAAAEYFCTGYEAICTYGETDRFTDRNECLRSYDSWPTAQQLCAGNALGDSNCDDATDPPTSC